MPNWKRHSVHTDPGPYASSFDDIAAQPGAVVHAVQGLLIHGGALPLYGLAAGAFDRQTLTVEQRLSELLSRNPAPLRLAREPAARAIGTCRDFAQLVCAIFRHKGLAARVRCGFAAYLGGSPWEDHWICEVRQQEQWTRIDAQLDPILREALGITVDAIDLPGTAFVDAGQAWRSCRSAASDPNDFGHGDASGLWFVFVNLMRDRLALQDRLMSPWDGWRNAALDPPELPVALLEVGDDLAAGASDRPISEPWWTGAHRP